VPVSIFERPWGWVIQPGKMGLSLRLRSIPRSLEICRRVAEAALHGIRQELFQRIHLFICLVLTFIS
jgi:hypothetical protein